MKKLIIIFVAFFALNTAFAQTKIDTTGNKNIEELVKKEVENQIGFIKWIFGTGLLAVSGYSLFLLLGGLKRKVDAQIATKAGEIIDTKLKEKIGADWDTLRFLIDTEKRKDAGVYSKKVLVVINGNEATMDLKNALRRFKQDITYKSLAELNAMGTDINNYNLLIMDGRNNNFDEKTMTDQVDKLKNTTKLILITSNDLIGYRTYSVGASRIAKDVSRLYIPIEDLLM